MFFLGISRSSPDPQSCDELGSAAVSTQNRQVSSPTAAAKSGGGGWPMHWSSLRKAEKFALLEDLEEKVYSPGC